MAKMLSLKGEKRVITMTTVKDKPEQLVVQEVSLDASSKDGSHRLKIESAYVVPKDKFNMPSQTRPANYGNSDIYTHLDGIDVDAVNPEDISILIGANVPEALL